MAQNELGTDTALRRGTILTTFGRVGAASCCALPILLASLGIGTAWLGGIAVITGPHRTPLIVISVVMLGISAVFLWRMQIKAQHCGPDGNCSPSWMRILLLAVLFAGALLAAAGYFYV